ncbi:MAG: Holliday junction resolvase RuvX [Sphingomonadaceae bacterium]|nr:Holliday junction resolvase RuvX [Sphingomonadaceae bacterium]
MSARALYDGAAFRAALGGPHRLIGIDPGTRTIGTAFCDAGWRVATPARTIERTRLAADLAALAALVAEGGAGGVVLGYPLNMDGSAGPRAQATRAFARDLIAALALPLVLWDERLSSHAAEEALRASGTRTQARVDAVAAALILQSFIDQHRPPGPR